MTIKNVMEMIVRDVLLSNKKELKLICSCDRCLNDIMAHALNHLPPRYIVNPDLQPYVRVMHEADRDGAINILRVVTQAATVVKENPRCSHSQLSDKKIDIDT
ncbi:late competence development ComFB family protein [Sporosarcina pasteurii]|uniref:Late competence development protein ComFB n=1 Tax=Sporosarcina pasteurii TaxID=1474 RepID=A0A380BEY7_SPOPA|nr:late competence development ComFB family protein [Sporosarcina pasteurii]MDS9470316.1 late competence development ComFB family protein [Sporosarcina pasteurii]SUI99788.1 Late competence development protein ComFB [Sporosarcina pasteurii]